jgi:pSer/pThr/pTyr-binding forkhead associated (FHA) protein
MATLRLEVVEGPNAGEQFDLDRNLELGRLTEGARLDDELVSRRHARFSIDAAGRALVEDLGSSNGTFVNGNEVHAPSHLEPGDHILMGVSVLELRTAQQIALQPTVIRPIPASLAKPLERPAYVPLDVAREAPAQPELDPLLDTRVKSQARTAPLGMFLIATLALAIYFATR